jgi:hypothetical protein
MMETASASEKSVNLYETTWRNIPEEIIMLVATRNFKLHI